ncbi:MAG: PilW family protein [bacterium]
MRPGIRRTRSRNERGLTLIELIIASALGFVVVYGAGLVFLTVQNSFQHGVKKLTAQQESTLLASSISRLVRTGSSYQIYNVPNQVVPADSGDGVAVLDRDGVVVGRIEWDDAEKTLVNANGERVNLMRLYYVKFKIDPDLPRSFIYRYATDDERGNLVQVETSVALRN